jgi:hypothetical protein
VRILHEHLHILVKPHTSSGGTLQTAASVTLTGGLDPSKAVDVGILLARGLELAETGGGDVAPLAPFRTGTGEVDAALVDDEARGQTVLLELSSQGSSVVVLIPRGRPLGVVLADGSVEWVVVGDVGRETADLDAGSGKVNNLLELGGSY